MARWACNETKKGNFIIGYGNVERGKPFPFNTLFLLIPRFFADKWRQSRARSHSTFRFAKWIALEIAKRLRLLDATFLSFFLDWSTRDSQSRVLHFEIHLHRLCFATRSVFQSLSLFNFWIFEFFSHLRTPQIFHLLIFKVFSNCLHTNLPIFHYIKFDINQLSLKRPLRSSWDWHLKQSGMVPLTQKDS